MSGDTILDKFTVDTKLFKELGEYLVGRESTALAELVKNAYDADATRVIVTGTDLAVPGAGKIVVADDGVGMSKEEFSRGFLRIGSRSRIEGERRSNRFGRRFTGAKGVGRLAAHKLGEHLEIESWRWTGEARRKNGYPAARRGLDAQIDWTEIERYETLDQVKTGLSVVDLNAGNSVHNSGTTLSLTRLRRRWGKVMREAFFSEVGTLVPLPILTDPLQRGFGGHLLFDEPNIRDAGARDAGFDLKLDGELSLPSELIAAIPEAANQVIEIDCNSTRNEIRFGISPSRTFKEEYGAARRVVTKIQFTRAIKEFVAEDDDIGQLAFHARIFERRGQRESWPGYAQGVRVYMEGFRVMPYGDPSDDWLGLKEAYTKRAAGNFLARLNELTDIPGVRGEGGVIKTDQAYFGAVFLRQNAAPALQMVVNREGFLPNATLYAIKEIVRIGIDLSTRVRYAATQSVMRVRAERAVDLAASAAKSNVRQPPSAALFHDDLGKVFGAVRDARVAAGAGDVATALAKLKSIAPQEKNLSELSGEAQTEQSMLRILASVGTQLSAFSHEIGQLVPTAAAISEHLDKISKQLDLSAKRQIRLAELKRNADLLLRGIERQAVYLVDVTGAAGRRRRSRLSFLERLEAAQRLVSQAIEKNEITVEERISRKLTSPPMFPAELTMVFSNLLTNAVKAAKRGGRILVTGSETKDTVTVRMENTGDAVELDTAERWFRPFESRTEIPDARLGQGMGLGLTITRSILDEYGASIQFVKPSRSFATAIELRFRK